MYIVMYLVMCLIMSSAEIDIKKLYKQFFFQELIIILKRRQLYIKDKCKFKKIDDFSISSNIDLVS